jgi:formylglycine-generating enzyme required for sulfatase activity
MGDAQGDGNRGDGERPIHQVALPSFSIDATSVTNAEFARFVDATDYTTEAESFGSSAVFHLVVAAPEEAIVGHSPVTPWWLEVRGADWQHPDGPRSDIENRQDHPVVHVTWNDAQAYCRWAGRRLPTEAEWERASRGGLDRARFPWGGDLVGPDGTWRANIWQGTFPIANTRDDGWMTTAPVRSYTPNRFGLWQTVGNVWEWCEDVFTPRAYRQRSGAPQPVVDPREVSGDGPRVLRGGSYLCHDSYCNRYRNAARSSNTPDSSMGNAGFRTVGRTARST